MRQSRRPSLRATRSCSTPWTWMKRSYSSMPCTHASGPRRRMLGTEGYCDCGRTDHRSSVTQHSWCDQSGDGPHTDAGSGQGQCKKPDRLAQGGRSCTSPKRRIHVHLDNASYHHAKRVREWLKRQGRKCVLHFIPPYCPHLDPIERCWGLMHQYTTHNRDYKTFDQFRAAILAFLNQTIPKKWSHFRDQNRRQLPRHITGRFSDRR